MFRQAGSDATPRDDALRLLARREYSRAELEERLAAKGHEAAAIAECLDALADAGIPFRIVPGISAGLGGLAYAGLPVTHRDTNHAVIFVTGHDETGAVPSAVDWPAVARAAPVIVLFMAVKHLPVIAARLIEAGRIPGEAVTIVSNLARPEQTALETTLGTVGSLIDVPTPAIVVIGPVARYRTTLDWYVDEVRRHVFG